MFDFFRDGGFGVLSRADDEVVVGSVQRAIATPGPEVTLPWEGGVDVCRADDEPGYVKIAMNFHHDGDQLRTETRVFATDRTARRMFTIYWLVIRAFSGPIRREWLHASRRRALAATMAA